MPLSIFADICQACGASALELGFAVGLLVGLTLGIAAMSARRRRPPVAPPDSLGKPWVSAAPKRADS